MRKKRYNIILLDQMMPGMDGITTLKKMKSEFDMQGIPVIALTADAVTGAREFYLENGFNDYLAKPVKPDALENALLKHLPQKLILFKDIDSQMETTRIFGVQTDTPKTMLVVDRDRDSLKQIKEKTSRIYRGTFVADMDKARKYMDGHEVDYVFTSREIFEEMLNGQAGEQ
jgi:PleD family two-component response regulator